jgi:hypothetical protein
MKVGLVKKAHFAWIVSLFFIFYAATASAEYVYSYTSSPYNNFRGSSSFPIGDQVTVTFDSPTLLAANTTYSTVLNLTFSNLSITDGINSCLAPCSGGSASITTNASGLISAWNVDYSFDGNGEDQLIASSTATVGIPGNLLYAATVWEGGQAAFGGTTIGPGTWSVSTVPLPAAVWLLLSGLGGLGAVARKRCTASEQGP